MLRRAPSQSCSQRGVGTADVILGFLFLAVTYGWVFLRGQLLSWKFKNFSERQRRLWRGKEDRFLAGDLSLHLHLVLRCSTVLEMVKTESSLNIKLRTQESQKQMLSPSLDTGIDLAAVNWFTNMPRSSQVFQGTRYIMDDDTKWVQSDFTSG